MSQTSGGSRGGARGAASPLFFDQNEDRRGEKKFWDRPPPPHPHLSQTIDDRASPLSERLDPPLQTFSKPRAIFNKKLKKRLTRNVTCIHMPVLS